MKAAMAAPGSRSSAVVVLDSSVWRKEHLLRSGPGAALLHHLRSNRLQLALPEVVEAETRAKAQKEARTALKHIRDNARYLRNFSGLDISGGLPSEHTVEQGFGFALAEMQDVLLLVPLTLDQVRAAITKVVERIPPNHHKDKRSGKEIEQFRDTLIWEAAVSLLADHDVYFVTGDDAFFVDKNDGSNRISEKLVDDSFSEEAHAGAKLLASRLSETLVISNNHLKAYSTLVDCLKALNAMTAMSHDESEGMIAQIEQWLNSCVREHYDGPSASFWVSHFIDGRVFRTEAPDDMQIAFELQFRLSGTLHSSEWPGILKVRGEGMRDNSHVTNVFLSELEARWAEGAGYPFQDRVAKYIRTDGDEFAVDIFEMGGPGDEKCAELRRLVASHGFEFRYSAESDGKMADRSIRGRVPGLAAWKALLSDLEQRGYWHLTVQGPIPWLWEDEPGSGASVHDSVVA
jgi:hypothetical protein